MLGYGFLPDHFHMIIRPTGDDNFSDIMQSLKTNFTKEYKKIDWSFNLAILEILAKTFLGSCDSRR